MIWDLSRTVGLKIQSRLPSNQPRNDCPKPQVTVQGKPGGSIHKRCVPNMVLIDCRCRIEITVKRTQFQGVALQKQRHVLTPKPPYKPHSCCTITQSATSLLCLIPELHAARTGESTDQNIAIVRHPAAAVAGHKHVLPPPGQRPKLPGCKREA